MEDTALQQLWRQRIAECEQSGMSVRQWCLQHDLTSNRFYEWRKRLGRLEDTAAEPAGWTRLQVADALPASRPLTVRVGAAAIDVVPGFDPAHLRAIVRALENPTC
jgi:transposase-like protein